MINCGLLNSEISEVSAVLRDFKTDYDKELTDVQNEYESYTSTFDKLNEEKNLLTTEIEELSVLINKFHKKLKDVDTTCKFRLFEKGKGRGKIYNRFN